MEENFSQLGLNGRSLHDILVSESLETDLTMVILALLTFNASPERLQ